MAIASLKKYENTFIVVSALIIALVSTLPFFSSIIKATEDATNPFHNSGFIIRRSIWYFFQSFISILVFIYFNFKWAKYITPEKIKRVYKVLLLIIYNVLLVYGMLWATIYFAKFTVGNPLGVKFALIFYFWKYILINPLAVLIAYVLQLVVKSKIVEIENYKLKEENLNIQLKTLQDQINPHFLFNTLNTLSSLIRLENKSEGLKFVDDLANVYRYILESDKKKLVTVQTELDFLKSYNYMLEKRFGKNLIIEIDISDELLSTLIPPMVFQLLIENAIKHNELSQSAPLKIKIYDDRNYIYIMNDIHEKTDRSNNLGIGLPNLIRRYKLMVDKDVIIQQKADHFIVKLPVIKP
ncbi:MAG: histidine kinase [Bacteroidales bacterium]|nr:histidine kinase [Bacteroidales bacterium]